MLFGLSLRMPCPITPYGLLFMQTISAYSYSIAVATSLVVLLFYHQISLYNEL